MIDNLYAFLDFLLPFSWIKYDFMKNAFLAILLVSPLFGILGTMIVNNKMAFFADSLGHSSYTGIAIGIISGISNPLISATIFSIIFAILITLIKNKSSSSTDTIIGVFSSCAVSFGLILMSLNNNFSKFSNILIGDLLSISIGNIFLLFIVLLFVLLIWFFIFNRLLLCSINNSLANSRGIKTLLIEIIFTVTVAVVVTLTINWVGLLIINSLLILPAATARNISKNTKQYLVLSILISLLCSFVGLIFSYYFNTTTGATIIFLCSILFFITFAFKNKFN